MESNSVCYHKSDNKITSMITDRIGRHEILLPINHKNYNFREKNSQVMKEREIYITKLTKETTAPPTASSKHECTHARNFNFENHWLI